MSGKIIRIPFSPQPYQQESLNDPTRFKVIIRGRRGGKTEEEIQGAIRDAIKDPGDHWITGPYRHQIKEIVWARLKAVLRIDPDWKLNESDLYAEHPHIRDSRGIPTRISLKGCDKEDTLVGKGLKSLRMDEAALTKETAWKIMRPMLSDYEAPAWFYTTPRGRNWLYDLYIKGCGNDKDWKSWRQPTSINKYISQEEIDKASKDMSSRLFAQEYGAEFLDDETGVFKRVRSCVVGSFLQPIIGRFYVIGVDLAKTEDFTVLTVIDSRTREVVHIERFQHIEWRQQKLMIQRLAAQYNNAQCVVDASGVGDPIVEDLKNAGISLYYDKDQPGFKFTNESKNRLIEQLAIAIEQRQITFPNHEILINELFNYEYSITDNGRIKYSAPPGKHDDCVISLALAVWGIRSYLYTSQVSSKQLEEFPADRQGQGYYEEEYEQIEITSQTGY